MKINLIREFVAQIPDALKLPEGMDTNFYKRMLSHQLNRMQTTARNTSHQQILDNELGNLQRLLDHCLQRPIDAYFVGSKQLIPISILKEEHEVLSHVRKYVDAGLKPDSFFPLMQMINEIPDIQFGQASTRNNKERILNIMLAMLGNANPGT